MSKKNRGKTGTQREITKRHRKRDREGETGTDGDETEKETEIIWGHGDVSFVLCGHTDPNSFLSPHLVGNFVFSIKPPLHHLTVLLGITMLYE